MPGIDFHVLRQEITMQQVLDLIDFQPTSRRLPIARAMSGPRIQLTTESILVGEPGLRKIPLPQMWKPRKPLGAVGGHQEHVALRASIDLCRALGRDVPWIERWSDEKEQIEKRHRYLESPKDVA